MDEKEFNELIEKDYLNCEFNEETRKICRNYGVRGEVRMSLGLFYIDKEYEEYRNYVLKRALP
jgi:hypothetical protein